MIASFYEDLTSCIDIHAPWVRVWVHHQAPRPTPALRHSCEQRLKGGKTHVGNPFTFISFTQDHRVIFLSSVQKERVIHGVPHQKLQEALLAAEEAFSSSCFVFNPYSYRVIRDLPCHGFDLLFGAFPIFSRQILSTRPF